MADIIRKETGRLLEFDPFQGLREWMKWDPFREMEPYLPRVTREIFNPTFEVRENKETFIFKADLPGVKAQDLEVSLTGDRLQIHGKRDAELESKEDTIYTYERCYGTFTRTFTLPAGVDVEHIVTELKDGVLTLVLPKKPNAVAKKIPISTVVTKS
jgi:HSP20 family protein